MLGYVSPLEWVLAAVIVLLSYVLMVWQFDALKVFEPRLVMGFYYVHIAAHLAPSIYFLFDPTKPASYRYFWACVLTSLLIPLGGLLGRLILPVSERMVTRYFRAPVDVSPGVIRTGRWFVVGMAVLGLILLVTYIRKAPHYPLKEMIIAQVASEELAVMRRQSMGQDIGYLYTVGRAFFMPFLFVATLAMWRYEPHRMMKLLYLGVFLMVMVYNSYSSAKTPVVVLFVMGFCLFFQRRIIPAETRRSEAAGKPRRRRAASFVALAMTVIIAVGYPLFIWQYKPLGQNHPIWEVLVTGVLHRIVLRPAINSYNAYEVFPHVRDYTYFGDVQKLAAVTGAQSVNLSQLIAAYKEGQAVKIVVKGTQSTNSPPTSVGTFYAQGGWLVLVLGMLLAAMMLQVFQNIFVASHLKTPIHQAMFGVLMYSAGLRLNMSEFHSVLLSEAFVPITLFLTIYTIVWRTRILPVPAPRAVKATG
jgi:hypothetical protein